MSMEMWSQVRKFQDGDSLNAKTLNVPVSQLGDRTDYLYSRIMDLLSGDKLSSVVITGVPLSDDGFGYPEVGNAVYLHQYENEERLLASKAKATMSLYDDFKAADSAFSVGILQSKDSESGNVGNVLVYGKIGLDALSPPIPKSNMIEDGEEFRPGRYYLSSNEAGKLTSDPNGPVIYVCMIGGGTDASGGMTGSAVVNPQFLDIGTSHVHRCAVLKARPAGELSADGTHVLGYGTIVDGPFHLLFGGTWTGDGTVDYSFRIAVGDATPGNDSGYELVWSENGESESHSVAIQSVGVPVEISNGIKVTLTVSTDSSSSYDTCDLDDSQKEWAPLAFPEAGQGWVDHVPSNESSSSSSSDEGDAPIYDYVLGMDPQVSNYWPPVPPKSAALLVNGVEMDNAALFPKNPTVEFAKDTIHWFEDDYGRKPWPEDIVLADRNPAYDKVMVMHWVRGFQGATGPVTSIQPRKGSPLKIYGYGTNDSANTGDLEIDASIDFKIVNGGAAGFMVPKRSELGRLVSGPVVERIVGGPGISVISNAGCPKGQGTVVVSLSDGSYRSQFSDIALENAEQAKVGMFPYIRLKGYSGTSISSPSAFTAMMRVPTNMPEGRYAISLSASVFGENGFTGEAAKKYACVNLSYNILPDFSAPSGDQYRNLKTSLVKPDGARIVNIPLGHEDSSGMTYNGFDPVFVTTEDPDLEDEDDIIEKVFGKRIPDSGDFTEQSLSPWLGPGYLVGVRISRAVTSQSLDAYTGPIGFINLAWTLVQSDVKEESANNTDKALDGVVIRVGTIDGIRTAVKTIGETFGATVVK